MSKFLEHVHMIHAFPTATVPANEDIFAGNSGDVLSDVINMENAKSAIFIVTICGGTGSASIQMLAADTAVPANTSAISFLYKAITGPDTQGATTETKTLVAGGASDMIYVLEADSAKLAELGYGYLQVQVLEKVDMPVNGAITAFLMGLRSAEDVTPTQLV